MSRLLNRNPVFIRQNCWWTGTQYLSQQSYFIGICNSDRVHSSEPRLIRVRCNGWLGQLNHHMFMLIRWNWLPNYPIGRWTWTKIVRKKLGYKLISYLLSIIQVEEITGIARILWSEISAQSNLHEWNANLVQHAIEVPINMEQPTKT